MVWGNILIIAVWARLAESMDWHYFPPRVSPVWGYFMPPVVHKTSFPLEPDPMDFMVDVTNSLGVAVLQDCAHTRANFAFSPYGMASVLVVLYEGACGESAKQIQRTVGFPAEKDIIRMGFRDIHRHLRSYFSHEGFLSGITLNKEASMLNPEYKKILRFYGYDVDLPVDKKNNEGTVRRTTIPPDDTLKTTVVHTKEQTTTGQSTPSTTNFHVEPTSTEPDRGSPTTGDAISTTESETVKASEVDAFGEENTTKGSTPLETTPFETTAPEKVEPSTEEVMVTSSTWGVTTTISTTIDDDDHPNEITTNALRDTEMGIQSATVPSTVTILPESTTRDTAMATQEPTSAKKKIEIGSTLDNGMLIPQSVDLETTTISFSSKVTNNNIGDHSEEPDSLEVKSQTVTPISESLINEVPSTISPSQDEDTAPSKSLPPSHDTVTKSRTTAGSVLSLTTDSPSTTPVQVTEEAPTLWTTSAPETNDLVPSVKTTEMPQAKSTTKVPTVDDESASFRESSENSSESSVSETDEMSSVSTEIESTTVTISPATEITEPTTSGDDTTSITTFAITSEKDPTTDLDVTTTTTTEEMNTNSSKVRREILKNATKPLRTSRKTFFGTDFSTTSKLPKEVSDQNNRRKRTIIDYLKSPFQPDLSLQFQNGMYDTYVTKNSNTYNDYPKYLFLVDGIVDTPVPMMTYTNVFQFGFIPRLHSRALIFPLDDVRYKLLILLPLERRGLGQLLHDLGSCSLREVIESIHPAKVRATIPTFTVEGFVILTSTLQKLGIWDVFDPRRANLSGMSTDPDLYVRNIEQSVTVVIRNYVDILDIQTRTIAARQVIHDFEVSHPFVYFVLDSATNVALMAGQMLDPLSSRIY